MIIRMNKMNINRKKALKVKRGYKFVSTLLLCLFSAGVVIADDELPYQKISLEEKGDRYDISMEYPLVKFADESPQNIKDINKAILAWMEKSILFKLPEIRVEDTISYDNLGLGDFWKNMYEITFNINSFSEEIVSIKFERYWYFIGTVHGYSSVRAFNYYPETGQVIQLKDVFTEGTDYLSQISEYVIKDLFDQYEKAEYDVKALDAAVKEGAAPKEENFNNFGLSRDSLVIYFDEYEVGSYSVGPRVVSIPYSKLRGITPHFIEQIGGK